MTRLPRSSLFLIALACSAALAAAPTAAALYMITPLQLTPSATAANVGETLTFEITPNEDDAEGATYENARVTVQYGYDPRETEEPPQENSGGGSDGGAGNATTTTTEPENPDETVSSDDETAGDSRENDAYVYATIATLTLSAASTGTFAWTVPVEVDDRNVFVTVLSESGKTLASAHVAVGDAPPIMMAMEGAPDEHVVEDDVPAADDAARNSDDDARRSVPAAAPLLVLIAAGLVAVALRQRR